MPTLLPGDRLLALRVWPRHSTPRGAMLILRTRGSSWGDTARNISEMYLVKRLIGVPGDSISVGASAVDCVKVDGRGRDSDENGAVVHRIKLGKNEIFVLGDSPKSGFDSYTLGPFPLSSIQAVVLTKL